MATYTTGQYKLGERYLYYVRGNNITSYRSVPDSAVLNATDFFTKALGVRVTTIEDLDALSVGVKNYFDRPEKSDIPQEAVERAVTIVRNYLKYSPVKSAPAGSWTEAMFTALPYVSPTPNTVFGRPPIIPTSVSIIPVPPDNVNTQNGPIDQVNPSQTSPTSVKQPAPTDQDRQPSPGSGSSSAPGQPWYKAYWWALALGTVVVVTGVIIIYRHKKQA